MSESIVDPHFAGELARLYKQYGIAQIAKNASFFKLTSGALAPFYCDNRRAWVHPELAGIITSQMCDVVNSMVGRRRDAIVVGIATGAIEASARLAGFMNLGSCFVRPPKGHGAGGGSWISCPADLLQYRVPVFVEDHLTSGGSLIQGIEAYRRETGYIGPAHAIAITATNPDAVAAKLAEMNVSLRVLADIPTIIREGGFSSFAREIGEAWLAMGVWVWSGANGGPCSPEEAAVQKMAATG